MNFLDPDQNPGLDAVLRAHEREAKAVANEPSKRWQQVVDESGR